MPRLHIITTVKQYILCALLHPGEGCNASHAADGCFICRGGVLLPPVAACCRLLLPVAACCRGRLPQQRNNSSGVPYQPPRMLPVREVALRACVSRKDKLLRHTI